MKLAVVNGSPRGRKSNSNRIIGWLTDGMEDVSKVYAADIKKQEESVDIIQNADTILFVFPLYTDAMPGLVKEFMERMYRKDFSGKKAAFFIHSGFPEAVHLRMLEKYCVYFAKLCGMELLGVAVMGGSEGGLPSDKKANKDRRVKAMKIVGQNIRNQKKFDEGALKTLMRFEKFNKITLIILKILPLDVFWNAVIKKNGAYEKRYDRPYL